jgi:hypothetical protein
LKNIFKTKIKDHRFWGEISKILNAGVTHELQLIFEYKKVFQSSVLSPFLYNIYMHEFDERVIRLQKLSKSGFNMSPVATKSYNNEVSDFVVNNLKKLIQKGDFYKVFLEARKKAYNSENSKCRHKIVKRSYLQYVRYFYDFIIGVIGS